MDKLVNSLKGKMGKGDFQKFKASSTRNSRSQSMPCIRRVPVEVRRSNGSTYIPSIVSIGPLHGKPEDQKADWIDEQTKVFYTRFLLERVGGNVGVGKIPEINQGCAKAMLEKEAEARGYYTDEDIDRLGKVEFAEMMMIDGCFIIELLYRHYRDEYDTILMDDFKKNRVRNDLMLLENQIPFSVLKKLFNLTVGRIHEHDKEGDRPSLTKCILLFLGDRMGLEPIVIDGREKMVVGLDKTEREASEVNHILHLSHFHYVNSQAMECSVAVHSKEAGHSKSGGQSTEEAGQSKSEGQSTEEAGKSTSEKAEGWKSATQLDSKGLKFEASSKGYLFDVKFAPPCCLSQLWRRQSTVEAGKSKSEKAEGWKSATQLDSNGLKFEASSKGYLFDVKFTPPCCLSQLWSRHGLQIQSFIVEDSTETFLRNMIAFEQCTPGIKRHFTSHAFLMDQLISSKEDVKLLEEAGIIRTNYLGCPEQIVTLFNSICKNVYLDDNGSIFQMQCTDVKSYCDRYWPKRRQKHCSSPWAWISVLAAIILFALTLLQTIYTMLSFY